MAGRLGNLKASIDSTRQQMLPIEFILIHDGVDAETDYELEEISRTYRTQLYKTTYLSPGLTRNVGLEKANTPWITFWDSDDIGYADKLVDAVKRSPTYVNVIMGGFETRLPSGTKKKNLPNLTRSFSSNFVNPGLWRFIFRKDRIGSIRFIGSKMGEDQIFLVELDILRQETLLVSEIFYCYFINSNTQLSNDKSAIREIAMSNQYITGLSIKKQICREYQKVIRLRMLITEIRHTKLKESFANPKKFVFIIGIKSFFRDFFLPMVVIIHYLIRQRIE